MTLDEFANKLKAVELHNSSMQEIYLIYRQLLKRAEKTEDELVSLRVLEKESPYVSRLKIRADEAERRVRWLEWRIKQDPEYDICGFCDSIREHLQECIFFLPDGTPKPTPEDFE